MGYFELMAFQAQLVIEWKMRFRLVTCCVTTYYCLIPRTIMFRRNEQGGSKSKMHLGKVDVYHNYVITRAQGIISISFRWSTSILVSARALYMYVGVNPRDSSQKVGIQLEEPVIPRYL